MATKFVSGSCPRCGAAFTNFPGTSRWDNETEICSNCEQDESIEDFMGEMTPMNVWPVERPWAQENSNE